jgi:uncharacterized protein YbaP (TraB family)
LIRSVIALLGALWLTSCGAPADSGREWPAPSPALWEVTATDAGSGWLFGTIHALPDRVQWRTPVLEAALAQSGMLMVEVAPADLAAASDIFDRLARADGLPPLLARFPPAERGEIAALLTRAQMREGDFARHETWGAALLLSAAIRTGISENGVDRALTAQHPRIVALEGAQAQLAIFDALPEEEQEDLLLAVALDAENARADAAMEAWLSGDQAAFAALAQGRLLADPELRAALLDERNAAWIGPVADAISAGDRPFVAVGAAHMLGDNGLPALLAARGFTVRRIQ